MTSRAVAKRRAVSVERRLELAALVVGDQGLNDADALGELGLGVAALLAQTGDSLVEGFVIGLQ